MWVEFIPRIHNEDLSQKQPWYCITKPCLRFTPFCFSPVWLFGEGSLLNPSEFLICSQRRCCKIQTIDIYLQYDMRYGTYLLLYLHVFVHTHVPIHLHVSFQNIHSKKTPWHTGKLCDKKHQGIPIDNPLPWVTIMAGQPTPPITTSPTEIWV